MNSRIENALSSINSGKLNQQQLENMRKNAIRIGGAEEVVSACDEMLSQLRKSSGSKVGKKSNRLLTEKEGYTIDSLAFDANGELRKPELMPIVSELVINQLATDITVLKTQIKYYYRGRHMTAGSNTKGETYYVGILDETKLSDSTVGAWSSLGKIKRGTYFSTNYVVVELTDYSDLHKALECVKFA